MSSLKLWAKLKGSKEVSRAQFVATPTSSSRSPSDSDAAETARPIAEGWRTRQYRKVSSRVLRQSNYGNLTVNTLSDVAAGFDMALAVRFVPFSTRTRASSTSL